MISSPPSVGSAVSSVSLNGEKLRNSPVNAVMAKLSPMENVILSIISIVSCFGNSVWVRQYPGRNATRMNANMYRMYAWGVADSGINCIVANARTAKPMTIQNQ